MEKEQREKNRRKLLTSHLQLPIDDCFAFALIMVEKQYADVLLHQMLNCPDCDQSYDDAAVRLEQENYRRSYDQKNWCEEEDDFLSALTAQCSRFFLSK